MVVRFRIRITVASEVWDTTRVIRRVSRICLCLPTTCMQIGRTSLHNAAEKGYLEVAEVLIRHGARVQHEDTRVRICGGEKVFRVVVDVLVHSSGLKL